MMLTFDNETSRPATGARPPVGSHMHGWGEPSNYKTQCSAAYDYEPLPSSQATPPGLHGGSCLSLREMRQHPFVQFVRDVACVCAFSLFLVALGVVAAIVRALVFNPF